MRATAQLQAKIPHLHHTHHIAVFFAKQHHRTHFHRTIQCVKRNIDSPISSDRIIDNAHNIVQLCGRYTFKMRKIKAQPIRGNQRTGLVNMIAQYLPQSAMHQMRGRVIARRIQTSLSIDTRIHTHPHQFLYLPIAQATAMHNGFSFPECSRHFKAHAISHKFARIPNLSARLGIKWRYIQIDIQHLILCGLTGDNARIGRKRFVSHKFRMLFWQFPMCLRDKHIFICLTGSRLLRRHLRFKARLIHLNTFFCCHQPRQIDGKTISIVQLKRICPGNMPFRLHRVKNFQPAIQCFAKSLFLRPNHPCNIIAFFRHLGKCNAHFAGNCIYQSKNKRLMHPQRAPKPCGAAQNPPQNIASPFIGRQHPICDCKCECTHVIGNHAHRHLVVFVIGLSGNLTNRPKNWQKHIRIISGLDTLQNRTNPLKSHPRIHVLIGQRLQYAIGAAIVLNKNQIPDLDIILSV